MARTFIRTVGAKQTQEFVNRDGFLVRADSSGTNVDISQLNAGDTFGSPAIALVAGDLVLLKDQTNSWENGVYVVGALAGETVRHASFDTAQELTRAVIFVNNQDDTTLTAAGPTARWYQNNTLTNLSSDTQSWTNTPTWTNSFTVPDGVYELDILAAGGGGGGGGAAGSQSGGTNTAGGGGGAGATPQHARYSVVPGEVLTIVLGVGGNAGGRGANSPGAGSAGTAGTGTYITSTNVDMYAPGGTFGAGSGTGTSSPGAGGSAFSDTSAITYGSASAAGSGSNATVSGNDNAPTFYHGTVSPGGAGASGGGGGAGGHGIDPGGVGGQGGAAANAGRTSGGNGSRGSGGGGAGGTVASGGFGIIGSFGGDGCVRISWGS